METAYHRLMNIDQQGKCGIGYGPLTVNDKQVFNLIAVAADGDEATEQLILHIVDTMNGSLSLRSEVQYWCKRSAELEKLVHELINEGLFVGDEQRQYRRRLNTILGKETEGES